MKRVDLDVILVVDIEATCWENSVPPEGKTSEIIQIGLCELMVKTQIIDRVLNLVTKPIKSDISEYCTKLTGLTQDVVDKGIYYPEASELLIREYKSKRRTWASFGEYDRYMFEKMAKQYNIPYPFGPRHFNVKNLCALRFKFEKEHGMLGTLDKLGIKHTGKHHDALDDARNIAAILSRTLWRAEPDSVNCCLQNREKSDKSC